MGTEKMITVAKAERQTEAARDAAIDRIEAIMMPGAQALCDTRSAASEYWIEREAKLDGASSADLCWRSQGPHGAFSVGAHNKPTVQVLLRPDASPEHLARLAILATDTTAAILRETAASCAAADTLAQALVEAFARVAS